MAKRRRSPPEDENWSDGGTSNIATDSGSESDFDDASFAQKPKGLRSSKRPATVARSKAKVSRNGASTSSAPQEICADFTPHSKSVHSITSPAMVRNALLAWYKTVHDTRGMPWRRPYDPNLGPEERAQRAYEVLELPCGLCIWNGKIDSYSLVYVGLDLGDHVATDTSCHSHPLL
jgi:A/G-specific adenine glycosylase